MQRGLISTGFSLVISCAAFAVFAQPGPGQNALPDTPGTGPFPALKEIDPGLPDQVVYRPADLAALGDTKLGVYAFGNGACSNDAASSRLHLLQIASHGYLAVAPGGIHSGPGSTPAPARPEPRNMETDAPTRPEQLRAAIDWALAENARPGSRYFGRIDPDAIAVSGFSCGATTSNWAKPRRIYFRSRTMPVSMLCRAWRIARAVSRRSTVSIC